MNIPLDNEQEGAGCLLTMKFRCGGKSLFPLHQDHVFEHLSAAPIVFLRISLCVSENSHTSM